MQVRSERVRQTGVSVQGFLIAEKPNIGTAVPPALSAQLDDAVAKLGAAQVDQVSLAAAASGEIARQNQIRQEVSADFLIPLGRIVRRAFPKDPDLQKLIIPAKTPKDKFATEVSAALPVAVAHADELIGKGMPADFATRMQAAVGELTASVATRNQQVGDKSKAAGTIMESVKTIRDTIHIIDGNLRRELKKNQPLLAKWRTAKQVKATPVTPLPGGDLSDTSGATPTPAPAAPTSA